MSLNMARELGTVRRMACTGCCQWSDYRTIRDPPLLSHGYCDPASHWDHAQVTGMPRTVAPADRALDGPDGVAVHKSHV